MNYKKFLKNKETRLKILNALKWIPDKEMIKLQYRIHMSRKLSLKDPQRYTEKLQWYKLYYRDALMTQCADKYAVRKYIKSKGYGSILNELYGVYDRVDKIDFDKLPNKFVLKTTNGSSTNIFCKDKKMLNVENVKEQLNKWMKNKGKSFGREWAYDNISPKIICERYLEDSEGEGINDYKFICFNGRVEIIVIDKGRFSHHVRNFYDRNWNYLDVYSDHSNFGDNMERPEFIDEMIDIAEILAKDFPTVRVDLYYVNNKTYFGELTFYPWGGYVNFYPDKFDYIMGEKFILPNKKGC